MPQQSKQQASTNPNRYVGAPIERVEDQRFLTGRGTFVGDLNRTDQLHAVVLRSPIGHGVIKQLDIAEAHRQPGVVVIITAADIPDPIPVIPSRRPIPSIVPFGQPIIANDRVRYVGEPIALVVAQTQAAAEDALDHIQLDIEPLDAVTTCAQAIEGDVLLVESANTNIAATFTAERGDIADAFDAADYVQSGTFATQRQTALPMECRGLLAEWDQAAQTLTMSGAAKLPFFNRRVMANLMGLEEQQVNYIELDVGGGFGARGEFYPEDYLTAFAARTLARPIKWLEDRREHLTATGHSRECDSNLEIAFDSSGRILGVRGNLYTNVGAYMRTNGTTPPRNAAQLLAGPYLVPAIQVYSHAVVTNKTPAGTYRGPGFYECSFFFERLLDKAAKALSIDRCDIRRRNLIPKSAMPFELWPVQPDSGWDPFCYDSGDYEEAFDQALRQSNWTDKTRLQGQRQPDGRYHGLGVASFIECGGSGPMETAAMRFDEQGNVIVALGSSSIGQGIETIMAQIAADNLQVPMQQIEILHGSTSIIWDGVGSFGSRGTVMGGSAVVVAAQNLLDAFTSFASGHLGVDKDDIVYQDGIAKAPDGRYVTFAEAGVAGIDAIGTFESTKPTFAYGTAVAHVAVDPGTGDVELIDYTMVDDVGCAINPLTLHGQTVGATVQGLGGVFGENLAYDDAGQVLVGTLADYQIPHATDYPNIHVTTTTNHPSPNNPLGAKGAGEGGIIPIAGVVANAVANALKDFDIEPDSLPLTPARVWELLNPEP